MFYERIEHILGRKESLKNARLLAVKKAKEIDRLINNFETVLEAREFLRKLIEYLENMLEQLQ